MNRLFLADIHEVARAVYDRAGADETRYPDAARKVLEDVAISAAVRHELAIKGLAAEAANLAGSIRRGFPSSSPGNLETGPFDGGASAISPTVELERVDVSVEVLGKRAEPTHLTVSVTVEAARTYLSETQRESRFGTQRRYIDFELADFENSQDDERAKRIGHGNAEKRFASVLRLMTAASVDILGDLPDEQLVKAYMTLRQD